MPEPEIPDDIPEKILGLILDSATSDMPTDRIMTHYATVDFLKRLLAQVEDMGDKYIFVVDKKIEGRTITVEMKRFAAIITKETLMEQEADNN